MFRTSWVHPQGDSCIYSKVMFYMHVKHTLVHGLYMKEGKAAVNSQQHYRLSSWLPDP